MLLRSTNLDVCTKSLHFLSSLFVIPTFFTIAVECLERSIILKPTQLVALEKTVRELVRDLHATTETKSTVNDMKSNVRFVEHQVCLTLLQPLDSDVHRRFDFMATLLPHTAFTTGIHNWLNHRKSYFINTSRLEHQSHLWFAGMPPSEVELAQFFLHNCGLIGSQIP